MVIYEELNAGYLDAMIQIENRCAADPYPEEVMRDCAENLDNFGCFAEDALVGFITVNPESKRLGGSVYIVNINVLPEYRRKGLAQGLIRTAVDYYARLTEDAIVSLDVTQTNPARCLYEKMGFRIADEPSRNGEDDVQMFAMLRELREKSE